MHVKLLLDENLSASVAEVLRTEQGIDACHVRDRDMLGVNDAGILSKAYEEDRILVTVDVDDFVRLARRRELHAGMILIEDGSLHRDEQLAVIVAAIRAIEKRDMVNRVLWVNLDGSDAPSCPRSQPARVTARDRFTLIALATSNALAHMPTRALALFAQRQDLLHLAPATWHRLIARLGLRRPRTRITQNLPLKACASKIVIYTYEVHQSE